MAVVPPNSILALISWSDNFSTRVSATPTVFSLTAQMATDYAALHSDLVAKNDIAENPDTRSSVAIINRNVSKKALRAKAQQFIRIITACPTVTPGQREQLGLNPIDTIYTPVPAPVTMPIVQVDPHGNLLLSDSPTPDRYVKPAQTSGAVILTAIRPAGQAAPTGPEEMQFKMLATRGRTAIEVAQADDTKKLYILAAWFNEKGQRGPWSEMAVTTIAA